VCLPSHAAKSPGLEVGHAAHGDAVLAGGRDHVAAGAAVPVLRRPLAALRELADVVEVLVVLEVRDLVAADLERRHLVDVPVLLRRVGIAGVDLPLVDAHEVDLLHGDGEAGVAIGCGPELSRGLDPRLGDRIETGQQVRAEDEDPAGDDAHERHEDQQVQAGLDQALAEGGAAPTSRRLLPLHVGDARRAHLVAGGERGVEGETARRAELPGLAELREAARALLENPGFHARRRPLAGRTSTILRNGGPEGRRAFARAGRTRPKITRVERAMRSRQPGQHPHRMRKIAVPCGQPAPLES
jgi:hypothetical protein